ncbi:hypothetical protein CB1_000400013 [Camelus ferus]|nr:hypothetical protein CB1_000400013 [Camelus ferus]
MAVAPAGATFLPSSPSPAPPLGLRSISSSSLAKSPRGILLRKKLNQGFAVCRVLVKTEYGFWRQSICGTGSGCVLSVQDSTASGTISPAKAMCMKLELTLNTEGLGLCRESRGHVVPVASGGASPSSRGGLLLLGLSTGWSTLCWQGWPTR